MATAPSTENVHDDHTTVERGDVDSHHPSDRQYVIIALILAVVTALEVGTYFITDDPYSHSAAPLLIGSLLVMMVVKFGIVVAYFMHLKHDNPIFRRMFFAGLGLALIVYGIVFFAFRYWFDEYEERNETDDVAIASME